MLVHMLKGYSQILREARPQLLFLKSNSLNFTYDVEYDGVNIPCKNQTLKCRSLIKIKDFLFRVGIPTPSLNIENLFPNEIC